MAMSFEDSITLCKSWVVHLHKPIGNVDLAKLLAAAVAHDVALGVHQATATILVGLSGPLKHDKALTIVRNILNLAGGDGTAVSKLEVLDRFHAEQFGIISLYEVPKPKPVKFNMFDWPSESDNDITSVDNNDITSVDDGPSDVLALDSFVDNHLLAALPAKPRQPMTPAMVMKEIAAELGEASLDRFPELQCREFLEERAKQIPLESEDPVHWIPHRPDPLTIYNWMKPIRQLQFLLYRQSVSNMPMSQDRADFPTFLMHFMEIDKKTNSLNRAKELWSRWTGNEFGAQSALQEELKQKILCVHYGRQEGVRCLCSRPLIEGHVGILCDVCAKYKCRHCGEARKTREAIYNRRNEVLWQQVLKLRQHLARRSLLEQQKEGLTFEQYKLNFCCQFNPSNVGQDMCNPCKNKIAQWGACDSTKKELKFRTWGDMAITISKLKACVVMERFCECEKSKAYREQCKSKRKLQAGLASGKRRKIYNCQK